MQFDRKRLARVVAVIAVALAAGHLVQSMGNKRPPQQAKVETPEARPIVTLAGEPNQIVTLAAGPQEVAVATLAPVPPLPDAAMVPLTAAAPAAPELPLADPAPSKALVEAVPAADPCPVTLELTAEPGAMIGILLLSPCHPSERVVLRHAGLAVTGQTTATGSLFTALPALEVAASVEVMFPTGEKVAAGISVPDLARLRRFGVQWQADDAFQINAFEGGARYGEPGHVSAAKPNATPIGMDPGTGGFLSLLGDPTTELPLLAEIYTFPVTDSADVVIEVAVTPATCGRELLGETLASVAGRVEVTDLTLAMPECDAIGDFLVLNNLVPDMKIAAAD